ncbi:MAG TPA: sigma-70 family RNA polymerase sigma factor [Candidatus Enterenecus merdae]|nr:sigma-70 family RNA polymerase sigma factor [Candidatus Enterenecus merdae]
MDRNTFISALFQREYPTLIRLSYRLTGSREMAEDLCQDAFFLATLRYEELLHHPSPGGWLTLTLFNLVRNERRKAKNRLTQVSVDEVANQLISNDQTASIETLLPVQLSSDERKILVWKFEYKMDYRDIANALGITEGAARMRVSRALKRCKELLDDHT